MASSTVVWLLRSRTFRRRRLGATLWPLRTFGRFSSFSFPFPFLFSFPYFFPFLFPPPFTHLSPPLFILSLSISFSLPFPSPFLFLFPFFHLSFRVHVCASNIWGAISPQLCQMGAWSQWITQRKSPTAYITYNAYISKHSGSIGLKKLSWIYHVKQ